MTKIIQKIHNPLVSSTVVTSDTAMRKPMMPMNRQLIQEAVGSLGLANYLVEGNVVRTTERRNKPTSHLIIVLPLTLLLLLLMQAPLRQKMAQITTTI